MNKSTKSIITLFFAIICVAVVSLSAYGLELQAIEPEKRESYISSNAYNIKLSTTEKTHATISSFDVSESGLIAIGLIEGSSARVNIYDSDGDFLYGYSYESPGDSYIRWKDADKLYIYFLRSDLAYLIDERAECLDVQEIADTFENNLERTYAYKDTEKIFGNNKYLVRNNMGIFNIARSGYSQLVIIDSNGKETIIYDNNAEAMRDHIFKMILFLGLIITFFVVLTKTIIKLTKNIH